MKKILLLILTIGAISFTIQAQSDNCAGATVMTAAQLNCGTTSQSLIGNTNTATTADGINFGCINGTTQAGFWYRFTALGPDIEILNNGAGTDPFVVILENNCPPTAADVLLCQQLDILDDVAEGDDLLVTGTTYLLWVGFNGPTAAYNICVSNFEAPPNDLCAGAININTYLECVTGSSAPLQGSTEFAGNNDVSFTGCVDPTYEGVWYTFTAQGYDLVVESNLPNDPFIALLDAGCASPTYLFCGQTPIDLTNAPHGDNLLTIGTTYHMWVGFDTDVEGDFELCIDNPVPPDNDECVNAIPIDENIHCIENGNDPVEGTTYGAFPESLDLSGTCLPAPANDWEGVWYSFTAVGHDLIVQTNGGSDPYIMLYDACPLGATPIICGQAPFMLSDGNDIGNPNLPDINNSIYPDLIGTTLYMWVGFDGGLDEEFSLCIENGIPPMNDNCDMPQQIEALNCTGENNTLLGSTIYSSFYDFVYVWDPGDAPGILPDCFNPYPPDGDEIVWYNFTATGVDFAISDLMGGNPSFAILTNNDCQAGAEIIVCDEMPYSWDLEGDLDDLLNVGQDYILVIAFPGGTNATDSFELCINNPPPPPNDLCDNAEIIPPERLDCPDFPTPIWGYTTNASQDGTFWTNHDMFTEFPCALDTTEDDGVWYRFTAIGTDLEITDNLGNNPTIFLMSYDPCEADTVSPIFCQEAPISSDFGEVGNNATVIGLDYLMYVTFQGGENESDTFELCIDNEGLCSSPSPPNSWCQTTPICGLAALDAYCLNMQDDGAPSENFPGCANSLDNPNWFSFVAGADNLSIQVQVGDCTVGDGIQIGMYEIDCTTDLGPDQDFCPASADGLGPLLTGCATISTVQTPGTVVQFDAPTEFGHIYAIVIDGWGPALCQIEVNVLVGGDPPSLDGIDLPEPEFDPSAFPFEGDTICAGAENVRFAVEETSVMGACRFDWTVNGEPVEDGTNEFEEYIDFPLPGLYEVCFYASNFCDSTEPVCIPVVVAPLDPYITIDTICEGDDYIWIGPFGEALPFDPVFDSQEGGDFVYTALAMNLAGCEVDATLYIHFLEENDDNPTPIDTVICYDDLPFTFHSSDPIPLDVNSGVLEQFELDRMLAHDEMCDSFFILDAYLLNAFISYATVIPPFMTNVYCVDSVITICPDNVAGNPQFTPDPDLYPDVDIHYQWTRSPDQTPVGTDSICLIISFDEFVTQEHEFEVMVTMTKGGVPQAGCEFGPFEFDLDLADFIPDSMNILGPDTVCIGPDYTYTIEQFNPTDIWPMTDDFDWNLSEFPGAIRTQVSPRESSFTFTEIGTGLICVTALDQCSPSATHCKEVVVAIPPPGDAGADAEECTNTYTLNAANNSGTWYTESTPAGAQNPIFSDVNSPNSTVTIVRKGEYRFGWVTNAYGCMDTAYVDIDFIEPMQLDGTIEYTCDNIHENYVAVFDFVGGVSPYVVTSANGTLNGMTFTSDPIPEGDTVIVQITDDQGCTGTFVLAQDCPCLTEAAVMNANPIESCGEVCVQITAFTDAVLDPNDAITFILHTSNTDVLGTVVDENQTGEFCLTSAGPIQYDVQYYVSIVAGNMQGSSVDLDHGCTLIAPGQPVIWYEVPAPNAGADGATCGSTYQLGVTNSNYPGRWEVITTGTNVTFSDQTSPNSTLTALGCGVTNLRWIETNNICRDTTEVSVEFYCNPTNTSPQPSCNMAQTELTYTFQLNGVGPFTENDGRGVITGNNFELSGIVLPMTEVDTLHFTDGNGCQLTVLLQISDCNCLPFVSSDTICGLSTTMESSGTGLNGFWEVSPSNTGPGTITIASPNSRITAVTVSEYGIYTVRWTEVGALCQSSIDVPIYFVNSPEIDFSTMDTVCNANYDGYVVSFNIVNGHPATYKVFDENGLPLGQIIGNTFTSFEIPSTQNIVIYLADGFACDTQVLDFVHDCGCFTDVGELDVTPLNLCIADQTSTIYNVASESKDGNDVLIYILYSDINDPLNSIIRENPTGRFSFTDPPMILGVTYYISAVLGTESSGGQVNYADPCLSISDPLPVTWYDATTPILSQTEAEFTCLITQMLLGVASNDDINDYDITWTASNGGSIRPGDENSANPQINAPGTYTVTLSHKIAGCSSSLSITIGQSDDVPEAQIAQPLPLTCVRLEVALSGAGSDAGPTIRYEWSGPGIIGDNTLLDIMVNQIGTYTLTLIDESNGCRVTQSIVVTEDVTAPMASASVNELLDCNTSQVTVSGLGSDEGQRFSYNWTIISGTGNIVGSNTGRDIIADEIGTYQIEVTNLDNGCTSRATTMVNADLSVITGATINLTQPGCDGLDDGQITVANVEGGSGNFMYSFNGGADFSTQGFANQLAAGEYTVVITDDNGCEYDQTVILVENIDFFVDLGETVVIEFGDTAYISAITNLSDSLTQAVIWTPLLDSLNPDALTQQFVPDLGQYSVNLTITNLNGCIEQDNVLVVVKFAERIYIPTAMNPTGPNPENQRIYIFADPESVEAIYSFAIYNRWGERMFERTDIPPSLTIDPAYAWDGMWQGELAPAAVYVYYAEVEFITGVKKVIKGEFTLLR